MTLPFKPSPDRLVYCKECFNLRKRKPAPANLGSIKAEDGYANIAPSLTSSGPVKVTAKISAAKSAAKEKKSAVTKKSTTKKPMAKKKK